MPEYLLVGRIGREMVRPRDPRSGGHQGMLAELEFGGQLVTGKTEGEVDSMDLAVGTGSRGEDGAVQFIQHRRFVVDGMTCGGCKGRVERALLSVHGVLGADVDVMAATADLTYDVTLVTTGGLQKAIGLAGYSLRELTAADSPREKEHILPRRLPGWPAAAGALATILLTTLYVAIVGLAQGLDHAVDLLVGDWYLVLPIVVGFGIQVGLFVYMRTSLPLRRRAGSAKALAGAGTGTSTVSMVACCAHHLTDVLPIIGLSGAALFLNEYRVPLMVLGIITNAIGIAVMARLVRRSRRSCIANDESQSPSTAEPAAT